MVVVKHKGDFKNTEKFLQKLSKFDAMSVLKKYAQEGVAALAAATPVDSGLTARSWGYEITRTKDSYTISWTNTNIVDGVPIAVIIQYGHGTGNGGWVQGRDYINPAIRPIFDKIANEAWREVTRS